MKVCDIEGLDLEAGETHTDKNCIGTTCDKNYDIIIPRPILGRKCTPGVTKSDY